MTMLDTAQMNAIADRHKDILHLSIWQRFRVLIVSFCIALYFLFCIWFFAIPQVLNRADWDLAGTYLADWVSYQVRPDVKIASDKTMQVVFPKFTPIGDNPKPDWLVETHESVERMVDAPATATPSAAKPVTSFMVSPQPAPSMTADAADVPAPQKATEDVVTKAVFDMYDGAQVVVLPDLVTLTKGTETLTIPLDNPDAVTPNLPLPSWASQNRPGAKVIATYGFSGWVEIEANRVKVRKRFLGWNGFFYDTTSAYFDMPMGQFISTVFSEKRLNPAKSNWDLAVNDFLYNPSWQHLDVWTKLLQTIVMAFVGTLFATIIAFPLSFFAARNLTGNVVVNQVIKRFFDFLRSVDMLIWALFFTRAFGPGPLAGISAIFFTDTGSLGKLYSEALENIDNKQPEGIKSVGASPMNVRRFGVVPQVLPVFVSQALYYWESNTRSATIIGAVGAGGIGLKLWEAMRTNSNWKNVAYMVVLILIVVYIFDTISNLLRSRLTGQNSQASSR
jgi:phosphonate transport system permease protein